MSPEVLVVIAAMWSPWLPCSYLVRYRWEAGAGYRLVALAFFLSFIADGLAFAFGGTWAFVPYCMMLQVGLFALALRTDDARPLLPAILVYAVLGTALYLVMDAHRPVIPGEPTPAEYTAFMRPWYPYQITRLAAFGLFIRAAWRA